jgi:hypothetical protein
VFSVYLLQENTEKFRFIERTDTFCESRAGVTDETSTKITVHQSLEAKNPEVTFQIGLTGVKTPQNIARDSILMHCIHWVNFQGTFKAIKAKQPMTSSCCVVGGRIPIDALADESKIPRTLLGKTVPSTFLIGRTVHRLLLV